jgi:hypothetical protein
MAYVIAEPCIGTKDAEDVPAIPKLTIPAGVIHG